MGLGFDAEEADAEDEEDAVIAAGARWRAQNEGRPCRMLPGW